MIGPILPRGGRDPRDLTGPSVAVRTARARGDVLVELYGKPGCHLCDDARAIVRDVVERTGAELREIDILGDPRLQRAYGESIPVVHVDGRPHAKWFVHADDLERAIREARRS